MKILIKSRTEIEAISQTHFPAHTALISITDTDCALSSPIILKAYIMGIIQGGAVSAKSIF